jgi:hypothetical protein
MAGAQANAAAVYAGVATTSVNAATAAVISTTVVSGTKIGREENKWA